MPNINDVDNSKKNERNNNIYDLKRYIESQVSIMDVIEDYGYTTEQVGRDIRIRCPFHPGDKNASLSIQPKTQLYHCFSCGEKGRGSVEFVLAHEKLKNPDFSLTDAVLYLVDKFDLDLPSVNIEELRQVELEQEYTVDGESYTEDKINVTKYNRKLLEMFKLYLLNDSENSKVQSKIHLDYLESRGLSLDAIHNFELGFCPAGALERMYKNSKDNDFKQFLLSSGLVSISYGKQINEFYKDRIMFPIKDTKGHVLGFTARTLDPRDAAKYKLSRETEYFTKSDLLYGYDVAKDSIKKEGKMIVLEGNMDVVSSHQLGLTNAVGLNGCSISEKQIQIIKNIGANVVLALDNDNAGHMGIIKIAEQLKANNIKVSAIDIGDFGQFKDNGDILQASLDNSEISEDFVNKYMSLEKNIFEFKLKYDYFAGKPINYNSITQVYNEHEKEMTPGEKVLFKRFATQNSEYSKEDINDILSSQEEKKDNLYAEIGMMVINPYLDGKNLTESQKNLVVSKIVMNPDKVLSMNALSITMNKDAIDVLIDEVLEKTNQKIKTQALKNEINCREKANESFENNKIFTLEGYKELHCELYKNDENAGKLRAREMVGSNFAKPYNIEKRFNNLCNEINNYPKESPFSDKINFLGEISNEILCINAFETKGIGKIERVFIESAAKELGLEINYKDNKDLYISGYKDAVSEIMKHNDGSEKFSKLFSQICQENKSLIIKRDSYSQNIPSEHSYKASLNSSSQNHQSHQNTHPIGRHGHYENNSSSYSNDPLQFDTSRDFNNSNQLNQPTQINQATRFDQFEKFEQTQRAYNNQKGQDTFER